jgi:hypothetical protein
VPPQISEVNWVKKDDFIEISGKIKGGRGTAYVYFRPQKAGIFKKIPFRDSGENGDLQKDDGLFFVKIPAKDIAQFYIFEENEAAATFYPARAAFETISVF